MLSKIAYRNVSHKSTLIRNNQQNVLRKKKCVTIPCKQKSKNIVTTNFLKFFIRENLFIYSTTHRFRCKCMFQDIYVQN